MSRFPLPPGSPLADPERFNNTDFVNAFAQSFVSFAVSLDPNVKVDPSNITPQWDQYNLAGDEMVFNRTIDDLPDVRLVETRKDLLARCSFWESMSTRTVQ
ncbi:hypothetical protein PQX77_002747 [Marasmius sp. AFHP31]|nr:hypothetical protein PQX77_002747 [Marasmius sp. AFHP31]